MFVHARRLEAEADVLREGRVASELADIAMRLHSLQELLVAGEPLRPGERAVVRQSAQAAWLRQADDAS